jgi:hypothetical protein
VITGAFGFVHGFGFSFVLQEDLQFTGGHFLLSLLAFNVGVELGQLAFLAVVLPVLALALHGVQAHGVQAQRAGVAILSVLVAHTAWHWMLERMAALEYVQWPKIPLAMVALLLIATAVAVSSVLWWIRRRQTDPRIQA